jgi:hypothetical protein
MATGRPFSLIAGGEGQPDRRVQHHQDVAIERPAHSARVRVPTTNGGCAHGFGGLVAHPRPSLADPFAGSARSADSDDRSVDLTTMRLDSHTWWDAAQNMIPVSSTSSDVSRTND